MNLRLLPPLKEVFHGVHIDISKDDVATSFLSKCSSGFIEKRERAKDEWKNPTQGRDTPNDNQKITPITMKLSKYNSKATHFGK